MRVLPLLAIFGCLPQAELSAPPYEAGESYILTIEENGQFWSVADDIEADIGPSYPALNLSEESSLRLDFFACDLATLGVSAGTARVTGAPVPTPQPVASFLATRAVDEKRWEPTNSPLPVDVGIRHDPCPIFDVAFNIDLEIPTEDFWIHEEADRVLVGSAQGRLLAVSSEGVIDLGPGLAIKALTRVEQTYYALVLGGGRFETWTGPTPNGLANTGDTVVDAEVVQLFGRTGTAGPELFSVRGDHATRRFAGGSWGPLEDLRCDCPDFSSAIFIVETPENVVVGASTVPHLMHLAPAGRGLPFPEDNTPTALASAASWGLVAGTRGRQRLSRLRGGAWEAVASAATERSVPTAIEPTSSFLAVAAGRVIELHHEDGLICDLVDVLPETARHMVALDEGLLLLSKNLGIGSMTATFLARRRDLDLCSGGF